MLLPHDYVNFWLTGRLCMEVCRGGLGARWMGLGWGAVWGLVGAGWMGLGWGAVWATRCMACMLLARPLSAVSVPPNCSSCNCMAPKQASDASGTGLFDAAARGWDAGEAGKLHLHACMPARTCLPKPGPCWPSWVESLIADGLYFPAPHIDQPLTLPLHTWLPALLAMSLQSAFGSWMSAWPPACRRSSGPARQVLGKPSPIAHCRTAWFMCSAGLGGRHGNGAQQHPWLVCSLFCTSARCTTVMPDCCAGGGHAAAGGGGRVGPASRGCRGAWRWRQRHGGSWLWSSAGGHVGALAGHVRWAPLLQQWNGRPPRCWSVSRGVACLGSLMG